MSKPIIGIDLGTTFSLVAVLENGVPRVLHNALGEALTPSAVSVRDDGEVLVGAPARARAVTAPKATALAFKRDMGTSRIWELGPAKMSPVQLSALVLKALKADAEAALGQTIEEAIVTVPAYFGDLQRQATRDAGDLAGLKVERIINEPTAAALAYGLQQRHEAQKVAVLDLGGGTFDVTVLEIIEGVIEVQATAGDARLGGEDFDEALLELAKKRLPKINFDLEPEAVALLREACRRARHQLSDETVGRLTLPQLHLNKGEPLDVDLAIDRGDAESAWHPLLARIRQPIERALGDAGLAPKDLNQVLLVGGATRMPCIGQLASVIFGRLPLRTLPPDEAVAMGAAVQAGLKSQAKEVDDLVATDVAPFSLGVATSKRIGPQLITGLFSPLIERGTTIPCSRSHVFSPVHEDQTIVRVEVYQGEHADCARNQLLGVYEVKDLVPKAEDHNALEFRFTYDLNGILEVEITRLSTGKKESFVIQNRPGKMSAEQLNAARKELDKWKIHPRELLPNTTALERADAAYASLRGDKRDYLRDAIARFRAALDRQNPEEIDAARGFLSQVTAELAPHHRRS